MFQNVKYLYVIYIIPSTILPSLSFLKQKLHVMETDFMFVRRSSMHILTVRSALQRWRDSSPESRIWTSSPAGRPSTADSGAPWLSVYFVLFTEPWHYIARVRSLCANSSSACLHSWRYNPVCRHNFHRTREKLLLLLFYPKAELLYSGSKFVLTVLMKCPSRPRFCFLVVQIKSSNLSCLQRQHAGQMVVVEFIAYCFPCISCFRLLSPVLPFWSLGWVNMSRKRFQMIRCGPLSLL